MGIEPTSEAWEAPVLPLNYARSIFLILLANSTSIQQLGLWMFLQSACFIETNRLAGITVPALLFGLENLQPMMSPSSG
jgi:hypothetical protein